MSKIKKHKNTATQKAQEPIGTRIAKAVFESLDIFLMTLTLSKLLMQVKLKDLQR